MRSQLDDRKDEFDMKSLDIDSISTNSREHGNHRITIEYTGGIHHQRSHKGTTYKVTVPYSSFSQKLQTIHRFGGKIISVSIPYFQIDSSQVVPEVSPERISEPIPAIAIEQSVEVISNNSLEINVESTVENVFEEPSEVICEISPTPISQIIPENIPETPPEPVEIVSAVEAPVASPKKPEAISETTTKPKKPKSSTKSSQGFSKQEAIVQPKASGSEVSEPIIETVAVAEPVAKSVAETTTKPKKPKASTKSSQGFSKQEAIVQPKASVSEVSEPILETVAVITEPVAELVAEPIKETVVDEITEVVPESIVSSEISSKSDSELTVDQAIEAIAESSLPETKVKKSKPASKSGSGFNKPKDDTKSSRAPRKPKS
jgi:hypothetical protein